MGESVSGSALSEVEYDVLAKSLTVTFRDGSVYTYEDVPFDVYDSLLGAGSVGQYFNANVRNAYSFR